MDIQWYPGHMVKTKKMIKENLRLVDVELELIDARAPLSTRLPDINNLTGSKDIITVLNKADLADKEVTDLWIKYFKQQGIRAIAIDTLRKSGFKRLFSFIGSTKKKTLLGPTRCMIIGVPNVGKSSFMNQVARRKSARTADVPGITRSKMWLKVSDHLELLDTPGILWPKFEDKAVGIKLALLGSIKQELLDLQQLAIILIKYLSIYYPEKLKSRYNVDTDIPPVKIIEQIAQSRGFLLGGGLFDIERCVTTLISEFRQGKLGPISLEKPEEKEGFWTEISNQDIV
ncbi:MAG: ribosome biogenesis GTPase YlqF [Thermoanaerobacteraceae bacterium]|nr:ribosome biogenesis GTPase YlqF [Thermoanaerobacteraceae bacterium]